MEEDEQIFNLIEVDDAVLSMILERASEELSLMPPSHGVPPAPDTLRFRKPDSALLSTSPTLFARCLATLVGGVVTISYDRPVDPITRRIRPGLKAAVQLQFLQDHRPDLLGLALSNPSLSLRLALRPEDLALGAGGCWGEEVLSRVDILAASGPTLSGIFSGVGGGMVSGGPRQALSEIGRRGELRLLHVVGPEADQRSSAAAPAPEPCGSDITASGSDPIRCRQLLTCPSAAAYIPQLARLEWAAVLDDLPHTLEEDGLGCTRPYIFSPDVGQIAPEPAVLFAISQLGASPSLQTLVIMADSAATLLGLYGVSRSLQSLTLRLTIEDTFSPEPALLPLSALTRLTSLVLHRQGYSKDAVAIELGPLCLPLAALRSLKELRLSASPPGTMMLGPGASDLASDLALLPSLQALEILGVGGAAALANSCPQSVRTLSVVPYDGGPRSYGSLAAALPRSLRSLQLSFHDPRASGHTPSPAARLSMDRLTCLTSLTLRYLPSGPALTLPTCLQTLLLEAPAAPRDEAVSWIGTLPPALRYLDMSFCSYHSHDSRAWERYGRCSCPSSFPDLLRRAGPDSLKAIRVFGFLLPDADVAFWPHYAKNSPRLRRLDIRAADYELASSLVHMAALRDRLDEIRAAFPNRPLKVAVTQARAR